MRRTYFLPLVFLAVLFAALLLRKPAPSSFKQTRFILGTVCEIELAGKKDLLGEAALERAFDRITAFDVLLSNYKETSDVSRVNREASQSPVRVDPVTYFLINESLKYARISKGLFDISIFPLIRAWGFFKLEDMHVPDPSVIEEARKKVGWESIQLEGDEATGTVRFLKPGMEIDLGGIAKGYICDEVARQLSREGFQDYLVNIGGNIYASGKNGEGKPWVIGIRDPRDASQLVRTIELSGQAVATSGDYERYFIQDGRRYAHIVNPQTGWPVAGVVAATVLAPSGILADAASTILFLTPRSELDQAFHRLGLDRAVIVYESQPGQFETLWLSREGESE